MIKSCALNDKSLIIRAQIQQWRYLLSSAISVSLANLCGEQNKSV
jgi:hypothetical protein